MLNIRYYSSTLRGIRESEPFYKGGKYMTGR